MEQLLVVSFSRTTSVSDETNNRLTLSSRLILIGCGIPLSSSLVVKVSAVNNKLKQIFHLVSQFFNRTRNVVDALVSV